MLSTSKALFRKPGGGAGPTTDATFAYVPLLLETGSASSLNTTVTDSAQTPNTVTRVSNPSTGWVSPYQTDGYWGNFFPGGASDTLNLATNAIPASGAFTFETFVYVTGTAASQVIAAQYPNGTASGRFQILWNDTANKFTVILGGGSVFVSDATYSANTWLYLVVQRDASNVWSMYVNGTRNTATASNATAIDTAVTYIGNRNTGGTPYTGYISNLRVVTSALYSGSTISVPTTPFSVSTTNQVLLTCYSNRFIDANTATTAKVITVNGTPQVTPYFYPSGFTAPAASPGAVLLNGSNQFLKSTTATTAFQFGTAPFTVEGWIYRTPKALRQYICGGSFSGPGFQLVMDSPGFFIYGGVTGIGNLPFSTITVTENAWTHFAVVRTNTSSNGSAYYINGVPAGTFQISSDISGTASFINVGTANDSTAEPTSGYIGNFRIVKGTAVYTGAFTPPSGPLTQNGGTYPSTTNVNTSIPSANTSILLGLADSNYLSATNGVQNNTFIDDSNYAFPITRNGTPTQGSITPYWPNGQWSNLFAANGDYISVPDAANLELGNSDFQMSAWVYLTAYPANNAGSYSSSILSKGTFAGTRSYEFGVGGASGTTLGLGLTNTGATTTNIAGSFSFALNTWYSVRATRVSNRVYLFVNGNLLNAGGTAYTDTVSNGTDTLKVGRSNLDATYLFQFFGYISNVSLAIGGSGYSIASYTPATTPTTTVTSDIKFLSCQSNRFVDNSSVPATVSIFGAPRVQAFQPFSPTASYTTALYGGSGYFGGSPSYLSFPANSAMNFGTGDFTVEAWVYPTATPGDGAGPIGGATSNILFAYSAAAFPGKWAFGRNNVAFDFSSLTDIVLNTWTHLAVSRSSGTIRFFINGALTNSASNSNSYILTGGGNIGFNGASSYFTGYMSQIRAVGTAVYTGAFTPPTLAPLATTGPASAASYSSTTNVNTTFLTPATLLLNMANAAIYDAAVQNDITTVGDAKTDTTIKQWPLSSVKFDGSGDYLNVSAGSPQSLTFGTGDFTIEFWVYFNSNTGFQTLYDGRAAAGIYPLLYLNSGVINYYVGSSVAITSVQPPTGVWIFMSLIRSSGTTRFFINGTQSGGNYPDSNNYLAPPTSGARVGANFSGSDFLSGYIQDFRVTKAARAATPIPTAEFPTR